MVDAHSGPVLRNRKPEIAQQWTKWHPWAILVKLASSRQYLKIYSLALYSSLLRVQLP
jgi:hypothetical protein